MLLILVVLGLPEAAQAAECTDTWLPVSGEWQAAENWSAEHVPTSSDVACIPKEKTAQVTSGTHSVEILQGEGRLTVLAGSLALLGEEQSHIQKLHLSGGALKGPAELLVTESLDADGGSLEGAGKTVVGAEATGHVDALGEGEGPGLRLTEKRELSVNGTMEVAGLGGQMNAIEGALLSVSNAGELSVNGPEGGIAMSESADLVNGKKVAVSGPEGRVVLSDHSTLFNNESMTLNAGEGGLISHDESSIQNSGDLRVEGTAGEIRLEGTSLDNLGTVAVKAPEGRIRGTEGASIENTGTLVVDGEGAGNGLVAGTGAISKLTNLGTIQKDAGVETTRVEFKIDNENIVRAESGLLRFTGGGNSGQEGEDRWVAIGNEEVEEEPTIVFGQETFTLGEVAGLNGLIALESTATVKSHRLKAEEAEVWAINGQLELTGAGKESRIGGLIVSKGGVSLIKEGILWSEEAFLEGGSLDIKADASATIEFFFQESAATSVGSGATFASQGVFLEAGTLETGAEAELPMESFLQGEATTDIGSNSSINVEFTGIEAGSFDIGDGSSGSLGSYFQENAATSIGAGSNVDFGSTSIEEGTLSLGKGADSALGNVFIETGTLHLESEASASMGNLAQEEGLIELGGGANATMELGSFEGGSLSGEGSLSVDGFFWEETAMSGSGSITVEESGAIESGEGFASLDERRLVTHGFFSIGQSTLMMGDGAKLVNEAEFNASSEASGFGAQIRVGESSTTNPKIVNKHEFNKETGTGTTEVTVPFENNGTIHQFSGMLHIKNRLGVPASQKFGFRCHCGDPVEAASGDFSETQTDFAIPGLGLGLVLSRSYSGQAAATAVSPGPFGYGWTTSFSDRLSFEGEGAQITVHRGDGSTVPFTADGKGGFEPPPWSQDTLSGNAEAGYTYTGADQVKRHFAPSGALQSVTDRNGNETTLSYTEGGVLKAISDPAEREITFTYNGEGLVESAKDPMGHEVEYAYEGKELASVTMPGEVKPRWRFEYDPSHRMTKVIDGRGGETTNEYDGSSRVVSQTDPAGRTTAFEYDGFHTRITNEATEAVTDIWFNSDNEPFSITDGFGTEDATTETLSYDEAGHLLSQTDGNGHTTSYTYNPAGDRTSITDADENETRWEYNTTHDVISETTPNGETTTIERDPTGNPETISRPAPGEATQTTSFEYEPNGRLKTLTNPLKQTWSYGYDSQGDLESETDPEGRTRTWAYDEDSLLLSTVTPRGNEEGAEAGEFTTTIERDPQGRPETIIDPLGHTTEFAYDPNGNVESETDAKGHTTEFTYNPDDQLIRTERPSGATLETEYDGAGAVVAQIDGNEHATTYVRNVLEQPIETIDPLGRKTIREFDAAGNLEAVIDPAKGVTAYSYDPANRLREVSYSEEATPDVSFEYDPDGNLIAMSDGSGESTFAYDQLDRLEEATDGHGDAVAYEYDLAGEPERIVYPNGKGVDQAFDKAGRLEAVTDWLGHTTSFGYDADSDVEAITFPAPSGNVDEFTYDPTDRMATVDMTKGPESLAAIAYARDKLDQVEGMASEGLPGEAEQSYEYDEDDRLIEAGSASYEYDPADNPIKTPGSVNAFDKASQLETGTGVGYEYDSLGERIKATPTEGAPTTYSYDQAGNLTTVKRAKAGEVPGIDEAFAYDGAGLMASRTVGESTEHLTWDMSGGLPLLLSDGQASYVYGPDGLPVEQIDAEEAPTYYHHDQLGSTRMLTDAAGEPTAKFTYDAYGNLEASTGSQRTPLGYAGQYTLAQSGLQYLRARFYDPATGQFLTRDPIEELTREPYAYAYDNPLNGTDPSGRIGEGVAACAATWEVPAVGEASCGAGAVEAGAAIVAGTTLAASSLSGNEEIAGTLTISKGLAARLAKEREAQESGEEAECRPSDWPNFEDPSQPPGPGWEWRSRSEAPPGSKEGAWYNPETGEQLRPDLDHPDHGPHYDYQQGRERAWVYPDGRVIPKQ